MTGLVEWTPADRCLCFRFGLAFVVFSSIIFGLILPILVCIIPQVWRRIHGKEFLDNHYGSSTGNGGLTSDETHPFLPLSSTHHQGVRSNISAARQFNESPSFQRLTTATSSANGNSNANTTSSSSILANNTGSMARTRYHRANGNATNTLGGSAANGRGMAMDEYSLNTDPYLLLNSNNGSKPGPSVPPPPMNGNYLHAINENGSSHHNHNFNGDLLGNGGLSSHANYSLYNTSNGGANTNTLKYNNHSLLTSSATK